jgi:hypothetical protein
VEILLAFDPTVVEVIDAFPETENIEIEPGNFPDPSGGRGFIATNRANNTQGRVQYAVTLINPSPSVSGSGRLARVTFRGVMPGTSELILIQAALADRNARPIPAGVNNGRITVLAPATPTPTATPTIQPPSPTPTATTPPAGDTPTPTVTPTLTPTPDGSPGGCQQVVLNPGFEEDGAWTFGNTVVRARYTTENRRSGTRSVRMGIKPPEPDALSFSSIWQAVTIPADAQSVTLAFWFWPASEEITTGDWQAAWIYDAGLNNPPLGEVLKMRSNAQAWLYHDQDLTDFRGQTITLYFTAVNNGTGNRRTWWYVDDVTLTVCGSTQSITVPPQPQHGPDEDFLLRLLNQP